MTTQSWQTAAQTPPPAPGEIHVWRIDLDGPVAPAPASLLSTDEHARAARLLIDDKRVRFIAGRTALRRVLGQYLGIAPQALVFEYGPHGKPVLGNDQAAAGLAFNFSNSENLALLAVARARALGIDIEYRHRDLSVASFARHILSASEITAFEELPPPRQSQALLGTWTRKEAYLKALGLGLSRPMSGFTTGIVDDQAAVRQLEDAGGRPQAWSFIPLAAHPDYLACLAAPGSTWSLRCFNWRPVLT